METGYYWIRRDECDKIEIAEYDSKKQLFFIPGHSFGFILSDIDFKTPVRDRKPVYSKDSNYTIFDVSDSSISKPFIRATHEDNKCLHNIGSQDIDGYFRCLYCNCVIDDVENYR